MRFALTATLLVCLAGCTSVPSRFEGEIVETPTSRIVVCSGHDCAFRTPVPVTDTDAKRLASIMNAGRASPQAERQAIGKAIQYWENRAADHLGVRDAALSQFKNTNVRGHMDCIDEATNSQSLMRYLDGRGLIRHHAIKQNMSRGFMLDGQFPHVAAVVEAKDGSRWAVDSWLEPTGGPVTIMPLQQWLRDGNLAAELGGAL
jgi:hypothetical protein